MLQYNYFLYLKQTFTNNMNSGIYSDIILRTYLPFMENCPQIPFEEFMLHQDNSRVHTSDECSQLIENLGIIWVN